jgi:anti-anti-sigma regulatory factor
MLMELADSLETKRVRLVLVHISAEVEAFLLSMGLAMIGETKNTACGTT